ncbi:hypothetical protein JCM8547_008778 [Rhodosporidiobolus lusitaniae]
MLDFMESEPSRADPLYRHAHSLAALAQFNLSQPEAWPTLDINLPPEQLERFLSTIPTVLSFGKLYTTFGTVIRYIMSPAERDRFVAVLVTHDQKTLSSSHVYTLADQATRSGFLGALRVVAAFFSPLRSFAAPEFNKIFPFLLSLYRRMPTFLNTALAGEMMQIRAAILHLFTVHITASPSARGRPPRPGGVTGAPHHVKLIKTVSRTLDRLKSSLRPEILHTVLAQVMAFMLRNFDENSFDHFQDLRLACFEAFAFGISAPSFRFGGLPAETRGGLLDISLYGMYIAIRRGSGLYIDLLPQQRTTDSPGSLTTYAQLDLRTRSEEHKNNLNNKDVLHAWFVEAVLRSHPLLANHVGSVRGEGLREEAEGLPP